MGGGSRGIVNRGNLRDIVILLSTGLALIHGAASWERVTSVGMLLVGCGLHFMSKGVLVRNQVLCNQGLYGMVRHPFYLSNYLVDMSFCLMSGTILLPALYPFLFFWAYGPSVRKEEKELFSRHRHNFLEFALEVPQVFPDPGSIKGWQDIFAGFSPRRISKRELARIARFWAVECFFLLLHEVREEGFGQLVSLVDYDGPILAGALVLFSLLSFLIIRGEASNAGKII